MNDVLCNRITTMEKEVSKQKTEMLLTIHKETTSVH